LTNIVKNAVKRKESKGVLVFGSKFSHKKKEKKKLVEKKITWRKQRK